MKLLLYARCLTDYAWFVYVSFLICLLSCIMQQHSDTIMAAIFTVRS